MRFYLGFALALAVVATPAHAENLTITQAIYGENGMTCDATAAVQSICHDTASCRIKSSNALCGDPIRGTVKTLKLSYRCGSGPEKTKAIGEYQEDTIECPQENVRILAADYHYTLSRCNIRPQLAARCDGKARCEITGGEGECPAQAGEPRPALTLMSQCVGRPASQIKLAKGETYVIECKATSK